MKKFKKILAIVVSLLLVFTAIAPVFAEGTELPEDAKILKDLGIMKGGDAGVNDEYLAATTTRMQTAVMFLRIKGLEQDALAFEGDEMFEDELAEDYWGIPYLKYLKANPDLGWVGGTDGYFNPEDAVTPQQYYKVLLTALGWEQGVDFDWSDVIGFARAQAMFKVAKLDVLTNADFATATVEALKASLSDGSMSLIDSLVALEAITLESAIAVGLIDEQVKIEQQAIAAVEKYEAAETETAAAITAAAALQKEAEDAVALVADTELAAGLATRIDDKKAAIVEKGAQLDAEKAVAAYEAAPFANDADITAAGTLETAATAKVALVKDTVANAAFAKRIATMKAKIDPFRTLAVLSATGANNAEVVVKFNKPAVDANIVPANFTIGGTAVAAAVLSADKMSVTLTPAAIAAGNKVDYALVVKAAAGLAADYSATVRVVDATVPVVSSVVFTGPSAFDVIFSEPIQTAGIVTLNNGMYAISAATISGNKASYTILSSLPEASYTFAVTGATDYSNLTIDPTTKVVAYAKDNSAITVAITSAAQNSVVVKFSKKLAVNPGVNHFYHTFSAWTPNSVTPSGDGMTYTLAFTTFPIPEGNVSLVVKATDGVTAITDVYGVAFAQATLTATVVADKTAPTVAYLDSPTEGSIRVQYSKAVAGAATIANYTLKNSAGTAITITSIGVAGNIYTINFANQPGGVYTLAIANIVDTALTPNAMAASTLTATITDKTAPDISAVEWVDGDPDLIYVTFSEAVATAGINSALELNNYRINTAAGAAPTAAVLYGSTGKKVKLTFANVAVTDLVVGQIADTAGNKMAKITITVPIPAPVSAIAAGDITSITTKSLNTIEVVINKVIPALATDAFTVEEGAGGAEVASPSVISYSNDGTKTTVLLTLTASTALVNSNDKPDNVNFVVGKIVSDLGVSNGGFTIAAAGIVDGIAPTIATIAQTAPTKFTVTYDEAIATTSDPLIASDFIVTANDGTVLVAGVGYTTAVVGGNVVITLSALPTNGHIYKTRTKDTMVYVYDSDNAALKANAKTTDTSITVDTLVPEVNITNAAYTAATNTLVITGVNFETTAAVDLSKLTLATTDDTPGAGGAGATQVLTGAAATINNATTITIVLTAAQALVVEAWDPTGTGTLNAAAGVFTDSIGNVSTEVDNANAVTGLGM